MHTLSFDRIEDIKPAGKRASLLMYQSDPRHSGRPRATPARHPICANAASEAFVV
ncbi:hypothetical protein CES85_3633 (plasmid) [Ochrobactrum quorumnocens]|uniref:Uncharacterized protein n=1 Tax=Ochrobactrum quorumnocens TaxID=271865 RepID=A0A248UNN8_9HYPH|nr:hypothetical protein CES85_3633 [[Ochrobactrum] quorumnocens]